MIRYSIIVPTYNNAENITTLLNALSRQSIHPKEYEIIIVDDGSTDATREVTKRFKITNPGHNIIYLKKANGGPASARNVGIAKARGSIIFFTDDDCEPPALWMEKMIAVYKKYPEVVGVGSWYAPPIYELKTNSYQQFMFIMYRQSFGPGLDFFTGKNTDYYQEVIPQYPIFFTANTGNISYYKWVLNMVGGFNTSFLGPASEDVELSSRIQFFGFELYYLQLHILHQKKLDWKRFIKLCLNRARGSKVIRQVGVLRGLKLPSIKDELIRFKMAYDDMKVRNLNFKIYRRALLLAFIWYTLRNFLIKWPFFSRIKNY